MGATGPDALLDPGVAVSHLNGLIVRIADRDRDAFRTIVGFLGLPVWRSSLLILGAPTAALAATRGTLLEVWRMSKFHVNDVNPRRWISGAAVTRANNRIGVDHADPAVAAVDNQVRVELDEILGARPMTVQVDPRRYAHISQIGGLFICVGGNSETVPPGYVWAPTNGS